MNKEEYKKLVDEKSPKEDIFKNSIIAFLFGGLLGIAGQGLIDLYMYLFRIDQKQAATYMIITLIFLGCLNTALGWFDKLVEFAKCGLIIPITGFAHSMQSAALEYRKEGLITGIGANTFKLAGSVIVFGVVSSYTFGLIRMIVGWLR